MKWFRFYDEVLDDPKCQRLTPVMFRHWVNVLCIASRSTERGTLPAIEHVAFGLRLSQTKTITVLNDLVTAGLLDFNANGTFTPHGWANRQRVSDDVAQRVTKHREKNADEPLQKRKSNVTETLPHVRATEADTETEADTDPPIPPDGGESDDDDPPEKSDLDKRWDRFWAAYPRHTGTGAAEKAFRKLNPSDELTDRMIVAVEAVKQTHNWTKDNGQFIPLATTWLNQDRWRDEPVSIVPAGPPGVELLPGETAEQIGPGAWNLVGRDGQVRKIRPDYCGVVFDTRKHLYEGLNTFTDEVAKAREGKHGHANTGD